MVELSALAPRRGRPRIWGYCYADLARLFTKPEWKVRKEVAAGRFDPASLEDVVRYWADLVFGAPEDSTG